MTDRLNKIFELLPGCKIFADIGCDHGYMAKAMLDSGKAQEVIISDISAKCLKKAEELLNADIALGKAKSIVSNGFEKVGECDLALISGMGGEEILAILNSANFLPDSLVLQPMKNSDKVRIEIVKLGYKIEKDFIFKSAGKFYDLILARKGADFLTDDEIEFGRTNLKEKPQAFVEFLQFKIEKLSEYAQKDGLSESSKSDMLSRIERLKKHAEI